jgi:UDP-xylose/UDP-N-acetylglucosamine transporter B4
MVMGVIILKKKYTLDKYISVGMITTGISICTIVSSQDVVSIYWYLYILKIF